MGSGRKNPDRRGHRLRAEPAGDAFAQRLESFVRRFPIPIDEVRGLLAAKLQRDANVVQERGHEHLPLRGHGGLVLRPLGLDRVLGPDHHDTLCGFELPLDGLIEGLAGHDAAVPPDRPPARLERGGQQADAFEVLSGVTDEDVRHGAYPSGRAESTAGPCLRASRGSDAGSPLNRGSPQARADSIEARAQRLRETARRRRVAVVIDEHVRIGQQLAQFVRSLSGSR